MDYEELTDLFDAVIEQTGSFDIAEADFKRMVAEDADLKARYRQWCHDMGTSERRGFADYCEERLQQSHEMLEALDNEYD